METTLNYIELKISEVRSKIESLGWSFPSGFKVVLSNRMFRAAGRVTFTGDTPVSLTISKIIHKEVTALLDETIVHECAHLIVLANYGRTSHAHGSEWREVMFLLGYENPSSSMNAEEAKELGAYEAISEVRKARKHYIYICGCKEHEFSPQKHSAVSKGKSAYKCRLCGCSLKLKEV